MKALGALFGMVFAIAVANEGASQQVIELKPPSEETLTGVIKEIDAPTRDLKEIAPGQTVAMSKKGTLVLLPQTGADSGKVVSFVLNEETTITVDGTVAKASDLLPGQTASVQYTAANAVQIVSSVPSAEVVLRTAKTVSAVSASGKPVACDRPRLQIDYFEVNDQGERLPQFRVEVGTKPVGGASSLKAVACWACDPTSSKCTHTAVLVGERKTDSLFMVSFTGWVVFANEQTKKQHGRWTINNKMIRADGSELILKEGDRIPFRQ
jgi:hypothetical protein